MGKLLDKLIQLDEWLNNRIFRGRQHQTISLRAALSRKAGQKWGCIVCKILDFFKKDHCADVLKNSGM